MAAARSPEIVEVRRRVPEFEPVVIELLRSEGPDLGEYEVMSEFARWVLKMRDAGQVDVVERSAAALETLATAESGFPHGHSLVVEFAEAVRQRSDDVTWMQPATRALAARM